MSEPVCAIVVPTLGTRDNFLIQCLHSIRRSGNAHICIVSPCLHQIEHFHDQGLMDQHVLDDSDGLPAAINKAIRALPDHIAFVNWLGDDDLLKVNALDSMQAILQNNPQIAMVFGKCDYIDEQENTIWKNSSGQWASLLLPVGPCLVPQPGALFRRDLFNQIKGLNQDLRWAFDLDLFIRMKKVSKLKFVPIDVASFRWHPDSLSVGMRKGSVDEASRVRQAHLPRVLRTLSFIWEFPVKYATYVAGIKLSSQKGA
jgi:hypothetical protein